jgi:hypothetical protein
MVAYPCRTWWAILDLETDNPRKKVVAPALAPRGRRRGPNPSRRPYLTSPPLPDAAGERRRAKPARCRWRQALPYPLARRWLRGAAPAGGGAPRRAMAFGPTAIVGVSATVSGGDDHEWQGAGSFAAVDGVRRRGPVWGQAGPDLGQAGPDPGQEGLGGASADVPATLGCRSSASALLLDSSVRGRSWLRFTVVLWQAIGCRTRQA